MVQSAPSSSNQEIRQPPARRFIDVHCHVFNAKDIALTGLIFHVALKEWLNGPRAIGGPVFAIGRAALDTLRSIAAALCKVLLQVPAPTPAMETEKLSNPRSDLWAEPEGRLPVAGLAKFLRFGNPAGRILYWRKILASYRWNLLQAYRSIYDNAQHRLVLVTPAILDFDYWLDDHDPSAIDDQVAVMEAISLRSRLPVHGFVPFDPARNIHESGASLRRVKKAIETQGFIGVKFYPPMGYRPSRNAQCDFPDHASAGLAGFGDRLDQELFAVYDWCEREEVPILTHTTATVGAGSGFEGRASPEFWRPVLQRHPQLRVNLAHFGHFRQSRSAAYSLDAYPGSWEDMTSALMGDFPNVYADLSYFIWIMGRPNRSELKSVKALFRVFLERTPDASKRFLYGTDWSFISHASGVDEYLVRMESFLGEMGFDQSALDDVFYGNALRFLGLNPGGKNSERLRAFYQKHGLSMPAFE